MSMLVTAGIAGASTSGLSLADTGPQAAVAGGPPTAISLSGRRNVMAHRVATFSGRVTPGGSRPIQLQVGGRKLRTHTLSDGTYRIRWHAPRSGIYRARAVVDGSTVRSNRLQVDVFRP